MTRGFKGCQNEMNDLSSILRDVSYKVTGLKSQLVDTKAIKENQPHADLNNYIPFDNDEDLINVLNNSGLSNSLYAKVMCQGAPLQVL